jgi:hypothetical protein
MVATGSKALESLAFAKDDVLMAYQYVVCPASGRGARATATCVPPTPTPLVVPSPLCIGVLYWPVIHKSVPKFPTSFFPISQKNFPPFFSDLQNGGLYA